MTLDEAITHAREVAIEKSSIATELSLAGTDANKCIKCKQEHEQLAKWLEELKQYRVIGTPEECMAALEKQKAKKPDFEGDGYADGHLVYDTWICPCCGKHYEVDYDDYDFCPNCGQKLDWSGML